MCGAAGPISPSSRSAMSGGASSWGRRTAALLGAGLLLGATSVSVALCLRRRRAEDAQAPEPASNGAAAHGREIAARVREEALKKARRGRGAAKAVRVQGTHARHPPIASSVLSLV